jgi:LysM repeat protein
MLDAADKPAIHSYMKIISVLAFIFTLVICATTVQAQDTAPASTQDSAAQQQIDAINGKLQDLLVSVDAQGKRLDALEKQISDLSDKVNTPTVNNSANADDLKKLAEQVQEVVRKQQDDHELILKEIEKLEKSIAEGPTTPVTHHRESASNDSGDTTPATAVDGYEYIVKKEDTLSTIAKAYRDQHIHVTVSQILKANPGLDPNKLYVGKKIIIPKPAQ